MNIDTGDHTVNGKCSGCGACCSDVLPLTDQEIDTITRYVRFHGIRPIVHNAASLEDFICPFRNDKKRKCEIYPVRPLICRDYDCAKFSLGGHASKALLKGNRKIVRVREAIYGVKE